MPLVGLPPASRGRARGGRSRGDRALFALCAIAGIVVALVLLEVAYQMITGAGPAISRLGLGFLVHESWVPHFNVFGADGALFGTVVTAVIALIIATPLGIAIGLYLALMAPRSVRAVVGPLVEMLAAIPSVIVGFWGLIVLAPFVAKHVEPFLHNVLGFIPLFGTPQQSGLSVFTAGLALSLMILPIVAALSRDLFLSVPPELQEGAAALGATRWEIIRGIVLPTTASGVAASVVLGLGRALGEAIAVLQLIGDGSGVSSSLFKPGITIASRVASEFVSPESKLQIPALYYLALILLVFGLATSLTARWIGARFDVHRSVT